MENCHEALPRSGRLQMRLRSRLLDSERLWLLRLLPRQVPHGQGSVPRHDRLLQSLVPQDRQEDDLLHPLRIGNEALQSALHGLPPHGFASLLRC